MTPAICVQQLSKRYQIGERDAAGGSFRELIMSTVSAPLRRMRRLSGGAGDDWFWALRDVAFDVQQGEVVAVIGRNGAGKSTLLKVLGRITDPTTGRVAMRGRVGSLLEVGTGFHPELTGRENVFLNGAILGMRRAEIHRKFDAIVEFAEVSRFIDTAVKHYSSGMYLRLAFAVAAHLDGEILLVDEVLAVGDASFQQKCLGKMRDVSRGGRAVVFVTHNMAAASALCQRGILLDGGRVVFDGPAQEAVRTYLEGDCAESATTWELSALPRSEDLGDRLRLERASVTMARTDGFCFGEPLRLRVEFNARVNLSALTCSVALDDLYGSRVVTLDSQRQSASIAACAGGNYTVDVSVPAFGLVPGRYLLSIEMCSGGQCHDSLRQFGAVSVVPIDRQGAAFVDEPTGRGPVAVPSTWRVSESRGLLASVAN